MSDEPHNPEDLEPYKGLGPDTEFWIIAGPGPIVARFGPFTGPECGRHMQRAIEERVAISIVMNCGREIDWELLRDMAPAQAEAEQP